MNCVNLIGRLSKQPEAVKTATGTSVTRFTIAVDGDKDKDGNKATYFFDCTAFRFTADFVDKYCDKGCKVAIQGKLTQNKWQRKDGTTATATVIIVETLDKLDPKPQPTEPKPAPTIATERKAEKDIVEDDLPF